MIFIPEEDAICLNDGDNILVFPLLVEEMEMLTNSKDYFENYINLKYYAQNLSPNFKYLDFWVIASIKDRAIIGSINLNAKDDTLNLNFEVNSNYQKNGYCTNAINLIVNWAFNSNIKSICASVHKSNAPAIKVLTNNNFILQENNTNCVYKRDKL